MHATLNVVSSTPCPVHKFSKKSDSRNIEMKLIYLGLTEYILVPMLLLVCVVRVPFVS